MKKNPRIYIKKNFFINQIFNLSKIHTHYIKEVLRMKVGDILEIFNDTNHIFIAKIIYVSKKTIQFKIFEYKFKSIESPVYIHLGQIIPKNEKKMDFTIQKSIEMGVNAITPLFLKDSNIKEKFKKISKKIKRWEKIAISSCQQCNRNIIPKIKDPEDVFSWCKKNDANDVKIIFHPQSKLTIDNLPKNIKNICIIIGSERGFLENEIKKIIQYGFISMRLGPRILRTETASIAAITALQMKFGDLSV